MRQKCSACVLHVSLGITLVLIPTILLLESRRRSPITALLAQILYNTRVFFSACVRERVFFCSPARKSPRWAEQVGGAKTGTVVCVAIISGEPENRIRCSSRTASLRSGREVKRKTGWEKKEGSSCSGIARDFCTADCFDRVDENVFGSHCVDGCCTHPGRYPNW